MQQKPRLTRAARCCGFLVTCLSAAIALAGLSGCELLPPESPPPFCYLGARLIRSEQGEQTLYYPNTTLAMGLRNTSNRTIDQIEVEFYLYDNEGRPLPEPGRNAILSQNPVEFPNGAELEVLQALDDLLYFPLEEVPIIDGLRVAEVTFADGSVWIDHFELYEYPHAVVLDAEAEL